VHPWYIPDIFWGNSRFLFDCSISLGAVETHKWEQSGVGRHSISDVRERYFAMTLSTILLIVLLLAALSALPRWPYSLEWGYGPSGLLGAAVLLLIVFALLNNALV
jgi:hypothetical protein